MVIMQCLPRYTPNPPMVSVIKSLIAFSVVNCSLYNKQKIGIEIENVVELERLLKMKIIELLKY